MFKILLLMVGVGFLIMLVIGIFAAKVLGKGMKMFKGNHNHHYKRFTSSGVFHNPVKPTHFGHKHYHKKHSSISFFSS